MLFKVTCLTDLELIGAYPQVSFYELVGHRRPYDDVWSSRRYGDVPDACALSIRGVFKLEARPTQVLSCTEISPGWGLVMEQPVIEWIEQYLPASAGRHPFALEHPVEPIGTYQYLEVRDVPELLDHIDFSRSAFCTSLFGERRASIDVPSWDDWRAKQQVENLAGSSLSIAPVTLAVRRCFIERVGVFRVPFSAQIVCTEPVARVLRGVTGVLVTESDLNTEWV